MLRLTLRQLEYVTAIAEAGSLGAAAARLNVAQPSLSVALAQVEAQTGLALFIRRKGAALVPAPGSEPFLSRAREVLALAATLEDPRALQRDGGRLRLAVFRDLAPQWLPPVLRRLRAALPGVSIDPVALDFTRLAEDLRAGRIDLAVTYDLGLDAGVQRQVLAQAVPHVFLAADDPLAGQGDVSLADLAQRPLILFDEGLSISHMLRLFRARGLHPLVRHRTATLEIMRALAANGEGVGIAYTRPPGAVSYDGTQVVARPIRDPDAQEPVVLVTPLHGLAQHVERAAQILTAPPVLV